MAVKLLGRDIEPISSPTTSAFRVSLRDAGTITIIALGASNTTNVTVSVAQDASGTGEVAFDGAAGHGDGILEYWTYLHSTGLWTRTAQAAASTFPTTAGTGDMAAVEIDEAALPDTFCYIKASHANATMLMCLGALQRKRRPNLLRSKIV